MSRATPLLIGMLAAVGVAAATGTGGLGALVMLAVGLVGHSAMTSLRSRAGTPDLVWAAPAPTVVFVPASPRERTGGTVELALARIESRMVFASAAYWTGVGFGLLSVWLFGWAWSRDSGGDIGRVAELLPWLVHPVSGMALVAAHRARTRSRRDSLDELFAACPAGDHRRDVSHLATAWVAACTAMAIAAALLVVFSLRQDIVWGPFGARQVSLIVGCGLLAAGAVTVGVLLGRWAPWPPVPVAAIVVIGLLALQLPNWGGRNTYGLAQLSTAPIIQGFDWLDSGLTVTPWLAHQLWIVSLIAVLVTLTVWLGTRRRVHALATAVAVAAASGTGWMTTRPLASSDADRLASMIAEPDRHQTCADLGVTVCVYRSNEALFDGFRPHLAAVLAAVPAGVDVAVEFRQGSDVRLADLPDPVAERLAGWRPAAGVAPVKVSTEGYDAARFWVAIVAVGITEADVADPVVDVAGQARGVVAIWLATRGVATGHALEDMASPPPVGEGVDWHGTISQPWPDPCLAGPTPLQWADSDLAAARALIRLPSAAVQSVVHRDWARWTDPATTTDELLTALGLDAVGLSPARTEAVREC